MPAACSTGSPDIAPAPTIGRPRTLDRGEQRAWAAPARRRTRAGDGALPRSRPAAHQRHPRRGRRGSRRKLGARSPRPGSERGRVDLRRLKPGDRPAQRPRTTLPRTARRTRRARGPCARRPLRRSAKATGRADRQHRDRASRRVENGSRGEVLDITPAGERPDRIRRHRTASEPHRRGSRSIRLGYAQHVHRAQGATVTRTVVVTGGWQTSKETAYVEATRARHGTDWFLSRDELGLEGQDPDRIQRLAENLRHSRSQIPSLAHPVRPEPDWSRSRDPLRIHRILSPTRWLTRALRRDTPERSTSRGR